MTGTTLVLMALAAGAAWVTWRVWTLDDDSWFHDDPPTPLLRHPLTYHDGGITTGRGVDLPPLTGDWTIADVETVLDDIDRLGAPV